MYEIRKDEPDYAFIPDVDTPPTNQWGDPIETVPENDAVVGQPLEINGEPVVGTNPNRYKQHGFHFTADNCIGCHACEAACSEKNNLPPHLSFRSVGFLEGGSYPAYKRLNISMACNHCDNPVCLKGCPTRAYTKYPEYGAVIQDPDTCFGCGYCTWVCPYNAPQLDPVEGQVSKCNMCIDRLEVGLKPACAAACLGGALDFGLIETTPPNREQAKIKIPGFPDPSITHPNIRFQQVKTLPRDMTRADTMPLHYMNDEQGRGEEYKPKPLVKERKKEWNWRDLSSRENPLVVFTLISQAVVGGFLALFLGPLLGLEELSREAHPVAYAAALLLMLGLQGIALVVSTMHLGKPHRFYRAFNNLKYSPVSREVASLAVFFTFFALYTVLNTGLFNWLPEWLLGGLSFIIGLAAAFSGLVFIYAMHKIYRIPARPFWNHWQVLTSFYGNMLSLGGLLAGLVFATALVLQGESFAGLMGMLALPMLLGLAMEAYGLYRHGKDMDARGGEGAAAHLRQQTHFGYTARVRHIGLGLGMLLVAVLGFAGADGWLGLAGWLLTALVMIATAVIGRALFYVLVIPTTMPGAFFWRNPGFQEHARETGLARMPQVGVVPKTDYHHEHLARAKRELKEEWEEIRRIGYKAAFKRAWQFAITRLDY